MLNFEAATALRIEASTAYCEKPGPPDSYREGNAQIKKAPEIPGRMF